MSRPSPADALLVALTVLPQAVNTFATSFLVERLTALPLPALHRLHQARPLLDGLSLIAGASLLARGQAWQAVSVALGLKGLARLVTAQDAHPPYEGQTTVLDTRALDARLAPDEPVVGLFLNGEARAYPLRLLRTPAVMHDTVGGEPVAVTWCPMSRTAVAIRDDWQGRRLRLAAVGAPNNDLVFFDPRSGGLISQLGARVMTGPNTGAPLQAYPATLTSWADWKSLHPASGGLWFEPGWQEAYINWLLDRAEAADAESPEPIYALDHAPDPRLPAKARVLGLYRHGHARAYTRDALAAAPVRNETLGGEPIVVIYDAERGMTGAFSRRLGGRVLTFEASGDAAAPAIDQESGTRWDVAGRAEDGAVLSPVGLAVEGVYWFAWAHRYPLTELAAAARRDPAASPGPVAR